MYNIPLVSYTRSIREVFHPFMLCLVSACMTFLLIIYIRIIDNHLRVVCSESDIYIYIYLSCMVQNGISKTNAKLEEMKERKKKKRLNKSIGLYGFSLSFFLLPVDVIFTYIYNN